MPALRSIPEQGQLAEVRRRRYMVSDVRRSLTPQSATNPAPPQHLVSLVSVEDDALGEELQVYLGDRAFCTGFRQDGSAVSEGIRFPSHA
jgi:hypothetical protein